MSKAVNLVSYMDNVYFACCHLFFSYRFVAALMPIAFSQPGAVQAVHEPGGWELLQQIEVGSWGDFAGPVLVQHKL